MSIAAVDLGAMRRHAFRHDGTMAGFLSDRARHHGRQPVAQNLVLSSDVQGMKDLFEPIPTSSGYAVTDYTAMLVGTVYACLTKIAGAVLQLPAHEYQQGASGDRDRVLPNSPVWWMLNEQPIANWTAASWKEWIVKCVHLRGDQVTEIVRAGSAIAGGRIAGLRPHHPDAVRSRYYVLDGEVRLAYDIFDTVRDLSYTLDQDDVLHFTGFGFDGRRSMSVIQYAARNAIGTELAASDYMGKSVGQGSVPKIALTYPHNRLDDKQQELLRKSFVATYANAQNKQLVPLVLTGGTTVSQLSISPIDMQLLESRKLGRLQICESFGVPPIMIGDSEKNTSWGQGVEQVVLGFVKFTLQPHLVRWAEELNRKLYRRAGRFVEFELDALLAGDSKAQVEAFRSALGGPGTGDGWMSVDEVRKLKNLPALGGDNAKPFRAQRGADKPPPTGATA
jgi:HK97 family phage portal protein